MEQRQERRVLTTEFRVAKTGKATKLCGYAAVFNSDSEDLGGFVEQIAPGAFDAVLASGPDVRCLFNHDPSLLLGRTPNTLTLRSDSQGLFYECQIPDTQAGRDILVSAERGDIKQSSFGFSVDTAPGSETWYDASGVETSKWGGVRRVIRKVGQLFDVSPVTYPAYPASSAQTRANTDKSRDEARKYLRGLRATTAANECARQNGVTFLLAHKR